MTKEIELTKGQVALVDDDDYEWLSLYKWHAAWQPGLKGYYAMRSQHISYKNAKQKVKTFYMHREIMTPPKGRSIDHINHDPLDNRKENLRVVSHRQNMQNRKRKTSSKYPGVCWDKENNKWRAGIYVDGKHICLGRHKSELKAAKAYENALHSLVGEDPITEKL